MDVAWIDRWMDGWMDGWMGCCVGTITSEVVLTSDEKGEYIKNSLFG